MALVMGVVNVTPDSFSDGGLFQDADAAIRHGLDLAEEGADWVDVGGESTRPGALPVPVELEVARVLPVVRALADAGLSVSVDTRKPEVARLAVEAGARMVNDVGGLRDPAMRDVCAVSRALVCIMHMQGDPATMQRSPTYGDVVHEIVDYLGAQVDLAIAAGVRRESIWVDPGIGFGKTTAHNLALLNGIPRLRALGYPVLVGVSRKAFLGKLLGSEESPLPASEREEATLAAQLYAVRQGADMVRCHDVRGFVRALRVWSALSEGV
jgi:dihydropteroate synthase